MAGEWGKKTLNALGRIVTGKTPPSNMVDAFGGDIPFVTPSDMNGERTISNTSRKLTTSGLSAVKNAFIPKNAVLVSCIGSDMGKVALAGADCVTNQQINSIVIDTDDSPLFVYYNLSTRKSEIRGAASGSAQPILNKSSFGRIEIELPSPSEQRAIAHILGTLRKSRRIKFRSTHCVTMAPRRPTRFTQIACFQVVDKQKFLEKKKGALFIVGCNHKREPTIKGAFSMPTPIKIEQTSQHLSARGGLALWREILDHQGLEKKLKGALPTYKIATTATSYEKFEAMVLGLIAGADNIDDMDRLAQDPAFDAVTGALVTARSYGDFLRAYDGQLLKNLCYGLIEWSISLRQKLGFLDDTFTLLLDSTDHKQHGEKMEGLATNYKGNWGLDSILAYDELGFQYWIEPRKGSTYTSNGAPEIIDAVLRRLPRKVRRLVLADSGFCNTAFFTACATQRAKFICAMRKLMYEPLLSRATHWTKAKTVLFHDGRECELASCIYRPKGTRESLRVVFMRALRSPEQVHALFNDAKYEYHAVVTNIGEHDGMKNEDVILAYRKRSDVERFIGELKNGFDLKHFPCQSLNANRAYALMAAFAQNLVRYMAFVENPRRPHFAKVLRFKVLMLPVQVVRHARSVSFRFMTRHLTEVERWLKTIKQHFGYVDSNCVAAPPAH